MAPERAVDSGGREHGAAEAERGAPYCLDCFYERFGSACAGCGKKIKGGVLKMRGLPFSATKDDIITFYDDPALSVTAPLTHDSIHIVTSLDGRPSGMAFVEFASAEDAKAALKIACAILPNQLTLSYCLQQPPPIRMVPFYPGRLQLKAASAASGSPDLRSFY